MVPPVPVCVTGNRFPAIVAFADLCETDVFSVQETVSESDPLPLVFDTLSQEPLPLAVQLPP